MVRPVRRGHRHRPRGLRARRRRSAERVGARAHGADASQQRSVALDVTPEHGPLVTPPDSATRHAVRVALVTCDKFPDLWDDDFPLRDALRDRGVEVVAVRWDDPDADWDAYDLAVLRSTWDYVARHGQFLDWARRVPRLLNPADVVEWNTDKHYLRDLAAAGVPVTPTDYVA